MNYRVKSFKSKQAIVLLNIQATGMPDYGAINLNLLKDVHAMKHADIL
jgi:hypothetical protein